MRRYLDDIVSPERLKALLDQPGSFDHELWLCAVEQGWPAMFSAERVLGLPQDHRLDKGIPFNQCE